MYVFNVSRQENVSCLEQIQSGLSCLNNTVLPCNDRPGLVRIYEFSAVSFSLPVCVSLSICLHPPVINTSLFEFKYVIVLVFEENSRIGHFDEKFPKTDFILLESHTRVVTCP